MMISFFAASQSAAWYGRLRAERERVLRVLKELSYRWQPVTEYLRSFQPWEVAKATAGRHLALIGLLGILVDWPDSTFLQFVDWLPICWVFSSCAILYKSTCHFDSLGRALGFFPCGCRSHPQTPSSRAAGPRDR